MVFLRHSANVWQSSLSLPYVDWYQLGMDSSRIIPCLFSISDRVEKTFDIYGKVKEQGGQRVCQALVSASDAFKQDDEIPGVFIHHLNQFMPGLDIQSTFSSFHQFRQYLVHSPDFMVLPEGSQYPQQLKPPFQNTELPLPTVTNDVFPRVDSVFEVMVIFGEVNAARVSVDPGVYFDCMNNADACPDQPFNSSFCPAGSETDYDHELANLVTCKPCLEGAYRDYSGVGIKCMEVSQCRLPFTTQYPATGQQDNICECARSSRFILEPYNRIHSRCPLD